MWGLHRFVHDLNIFRKIGLRNCLESLLWPSVSIDFKLILWVIWTVLIQSEEELLGLSSYHLGLEMIKLNTILSFQFNWAIFSISWWLRFANFIVVITFWTGMVGWVPISVRMIMRNFLTVKIWRLPHPDTLHWWRQRSHSSRWLTVLLWPSVPIWNLNRVCSFNILFSY